MSPRSAACAAATTFAGALVDGCPTSRCSTSAPLAARAFAARITSMTMKGGIWPRRETLSTIGLAPTLCRCGQPIAARIGKHRAALIVARNAVRAGDAVDAAELRRFRELALAERQSGLGK